MHQEAEKLIGRQANEVHEVRSLADQLLKQQLEARSKEAAPIEESLEEDFFVDPKQAVNRQVEKHPAVLEAKQAALELKKMKTAQQLAAKEANLVGYAEQKDGDRIVSVITDTFGLKWNELPATPQRFPTLSQGLT